MAALVVPPDVACLVPAVVGERSGCGVGIAPVAGEQGWPRDQHLAIVGELHLHGRDRSAYGAEAVVTLIRGRGNAAFGGAVALHDHDPDVLPGLLK